MSVSIEQYRARIGSHANFIKHRELESHLKNEFWNTMLMLFYMNVFYLPALKRLLLQRQIYETSVWFVKTLCYYHVYVPLLLRLSNDVETNPGPTVYDIIDPTTTTCADFSQGDTRFGFSAGKQCVAMSLTAIVYNQLETVSTWNSSSLNTILLNGNGLYNYISNSIRKDFLLLTEVPEMISLSSNIYTLQYSDSYTGSVFMTVSNEPYMSLEDSLKRLFLSSQLDYNQALLTIGCNTVAIFKISEVVFRVFDSHSRDTYGMPHLFGKCVLLKISSIPDLVTYFQSISAQVGGDLPYEIKGVSISFTATEEMDVNKSSSPNEKQQSSNQLEQTTRSQQDLTSECSEQKLTKAQQYYRRKLQNETPEQRERRLSRQREYKRKQRANQSSESRAETLRQRRQYEKQRIEHETPEKRDDRLSKLRQQRTQQLQNETSELRIERLSKLKQHTANILQNETPEKRIERLLKLKQHTANVLQNETLEQRIARLFKLKQHRENVLQNETTEKRIERLSQLKQHTASVLENETPEQRIARLSKLKQHRENVLQNESPEKRIKRLSKLKRHTASVLENETPEQRIAPLSKLKQQRKCTSK